LAEFVALPWQDAQLLVLLLAANSAPVLAKRLLGNRWSSPIDGGRRLPDGRPLLGASKTWRGLVSGIAAAAMVGALLGFGFMFGALFGAASLAGDLVSSFIKRRLGITSSGRATGLDQIPEALLPLLYARSALGLELVDLVLLTLVFLGGSLVLSRLAFRLGIREQPY
jgi:hypothetical protein